MICAGLGSYLYKTLNSLYSLNCNLQPYTGHELVMGWTDIVPMKLYLYPLVSV